MSTPVIPHDEAHRFLAWQPTRAHCVAWLQHFEDQGAPHALVHVPERGFTIYKHAWADGPNGRFCCGARR